MDENKTTRIGTTIENQDNPNPLRQLHGDTETIELGGLFTRQVTQTGSFDLRGIQQTSLARLLNAMPIPGLLVDHTHLVVLANPACEKIGYNHEQIQGKPFASLVGAQPGAKAQELIQQVFTERKPRLFEVMLGQRRTQKWIRMHLRSVRIGSNQFVIVLVEDLTPEKRELLLREKYANEISKARDHLAKEVEERTAELASRNEQLSREIAVRREVAQALSESEERLRAIIETATDVIYIKDRSLRYTFVNPALERILEVPAAVILGRTDADLFGKEAARHMGHVDSRVLKGETVEEEHTRPVKGAPMTFLDTRAPMRDSSGEIVGICGISRNMTERRATQLLPEEAYGEYQSIAMRATVEKALLVARTDSTVLLVGESGTGKDYLARFVHRRSKRSDGPFFAINCAAIASTLAESELFGHESGAFTGALRRKRGLLELAEGGTLLLNEIGELSLSLQAKLLTFLDTKFFTRVGGEKRVTVDARLIAATSRNLEREVQQGHFRGDLFYRLNVMGIRVPPLRERVEDIPVLVQQIISQLAPEMQIDPPEINARILEQFAEYEWPGNVRELRNVLERGLILGQGRSLEMEFFTLGKGHEGMPDSLRPEKGIRSFDEIVRDTKRELIESALRRAGGKRLEAARLLGMTRYALKRQMKTLGFSGDNGQ